MGDRPLCLRCAAGPANDNFAARTSISGTSGSRSVALQLATIETGEPLNFRVDYDFRNFFRTVWFKYTAAAAGAASFGVTNGAAVSVYAEGAAASLSTLRLLGATTEGKVTVAVTAGQVLAIQVENSASSGSESTTLSWSAGGECSISCVSVTAEVVTGLMACLAEQRDLATTTSRHAPPSAAHPARRTS